MAKKISFYNATVEIDRDEVAEAVRKEFEPNEIFQPSDIRTCYEPDDIFSYVDLAAWAKENGFFEKEK
jgi:hypothetical protein